MKRKRFIKLVMSEGCDKRTAEIVADFAVMIYNNYSTAYFDNGFRHFSGLSVRTKECATSGEAILVELLTDIIAFRHGITTILGCDCCVCCDRCSKDEDTDCFKNIGDCVCSELIEVVEFSPVDSNSLNKGVISICKGEIEYPISNEKMDSCYISNGETYPLCKGQPDNKECNDCNLYEDMAEPSDQD